MYKFIIIIVTSVIIISESSADDDEIINSSAFSGTWQGNVEVVYKPDLWDKSVTENVSFVFQNCHGELEIRMNHGNRKNMQMQGPFVTNHENGTYHIYTLNSRRKWVQTNIWSIVQISDDQAYFQWLRDVNNFGLENDNKKRYFGILGKGKLSKISDACHFSE